MNSNDNDVLDFANSRCNADQDQVEFFTLKRFDILEYSVELQIKMDKSLEIGKDVLYTYNVFRNGKIIEEHLVKYLAYALLYYNQKVKTIIEKVSGRAGWYNNRMNGLDCRLCENRKRCKGEEKTRVACKPVSTIHVADTPKDLQKVVVNV